MTDALRTAAEALLNVLDEVAEYVTCDPIAEARGHGESLTSAMTTLRVALAEARQPAGEFAPDPRPAGARGRCHITETGR